MSIDLAPLFDFSQLGMPECWPREAQVASIISAERTRVQVCNVVATAELGVKLDLRVLARSLPAAEYKPQVSREHVLKKKHENARAVRALCALVTLCVC